MNLSVTQSYENKCALLSFHSYKRERMVAKCIRMRIYFEIDRKANGISKSNAK